MEQNNFIFIKANNLEKIITFLFTELKNEKHRLHHCEIQIYRSQPPVPANLWALTPVSDIEHLESLEFPLRRSIICSNEVALGELLVGAWS